MAIAHRDIAVEWTGKMQPNKLGFLDGVDEKSRLGRSRDHSGVSCIRPLQV